VDLKQWELIEVYIIFLVIFWGTASGDCAPMVVIKTELHTCNQSRYLLSSLESFRSTFFV
jgi:hypothetical protein